MSVERNQRIGDFSYSNMVYIDYREVAMAGMQKLVYVLLYSVCILTVANELCYFNGSFVLALKVSSD